jgi:hypothetical protein
LVFTGLKVGIFWRTTPRGTDPWGFLPSVLGSTLLLIFYALISQFYVFGKFLYFFASNQAFLTGYGILQTVISGLVFGGLFGWAYAGKKMLVPFISVSVIGNLLRYAISTGGIAYTYPAFNINWRLPVYWNTNIWFTLWSLTLIIMSSMIPGALLGWQVNRANRIQHNRILMTEG